MAKAVKNILSNPGTVLGAIAIGAAVVATGGLAAAFAAPALSFAGVASSLGASLVLGGIASGLAGGVKTPNLPPRATTQSSLGSSISVTAPDSAAPLQLVYGKVRKGGTIVYLDSNSGPNGQGKKNEYLDIVVVLCGGPIGNIGSLYFDGVEVIDENNDLVNSRFDGHVSMERRYGTANQSAFTLPSNGSKWTANHKLNGLAAVCLRLRYSRDVYPRGLPKMTFDVTGRNDIETASTTEYSSNTAYCLANYMADPVFGIGAGIDDEGGIDKTSLDAAAAVCAENVTKNGGGTHSLYQCNGVIDTVNQSPAQVIEDMASAMAGHVVYQDGKWKVYAGAYVSPVHTLTDDDVRSAGVTLATKTSAAEQFNAVRGDFFSRENNYQRSSYPPVTSSFYEAEDNGERRYTRLDLPFTTDAARAQRIARIKLNQSRLQQTLIWHGKFSCYRVQAGETVLIDRPRWGYNDKPFFVEEVDLRFDPNEGIVCDLRLRETSPLAYDSNASEEEIFEAAPATTLPSAFDIDPPSTPQLNEQIYATRDGTGTRVLIDVEWQDTNNAFALTYQVEARRTEDLDGTPTGDGFTTYGVTDQTGFEIRDVQPGVWDVRVKAISTLGVSSAYASAEITVQGLTSPPSALTGLTVQKSGGIALLRWNPSDDLDVKIGGRIVIRHSEASTRAWGNARKLDEVPGSAGRAAVPLLPGTYFVRALDNTGNLGDAASVDSDDADILAFTTLSTLQADPTFPGTKDNLTVDSGLELTDTTADGRYDFQSVMDLGSVKRVRLISEVQFSGVDVNDLVFSRTALLRDWASVFGADLDGLNVVMWARTTEDDPASSPTWTEWQRLENNAVLARGVDAYAEVTTENPDYNLLITRLRVRADEVV